MLLFPLCRSALRSAVAVGCGVVLACSSVAPAQAAGEPALVNAEAVRPVIALMNQRNVLDNVVASVQDGAGLVLERLSSSIKKTASPECSPLNGAPGAWIRSCTVKATYGALFREVTFEVVDLSGFNPTIVGAPSPGALLTVAGVPAGLPVAYRWYHQNGADVSYEAAYTVQAADVGLAIQCDVSVTYGGINAIPGSGAVRTVRAGSVGKVQAVIAATLRRATIPHTTQGVVDLSLTVPSLGAWAGTVDVVVGANLVVIPIEMTGTAAVTLPKLAVGAYPIQASYRGSPVATYASVAVGTLTVVKGVTPKVKAAFTAKSVKHTKRAKLNVRVSASGVKRPAGQVTVTWQKGKTKDSATYTLKASKRGKATLNLPKIKKKGSYKVTVTFTGTGRVGTASARTKLRVT